MWGRPTNGSAPLQLGPPPPPPRVARLRPALPVRASRKLVVTRRGRREAAHEASYLCIRGASAVEGLKASEVSLRGRHCAVRDILFGVRLERRR